MERPEESLTEEFRTWARKRFCVRRYLLETLGMPNYGINGLTKKIDQENQVFKNITQYADQLLANAIVDAMPADSNPYDFCEDLFGIKTELKNVAAMTPEGNQRRSRKSPKEQFEEIFGDMSEEDKQAFKDILNNND